MSQLKVNTIRHTGASSDAITLASDGTATAKITNNLSNRNLVINGAMNVAQYGTSITAEGYTCDRWNLIYTGADNAPTLTQHALTSSDTGPWAKGFRNSLHLQNGNQSSGAGANDYMIIRYCIEAQDLANSGWDYTSASSYITLSYWVKSSVAQNFYNYLRTHDGTLQLYCWETGSLSANTWTKITKTIPGNSNITIDNNNGGGMYITIPLWWGGTWTNNNSLNTWAAYDTNNRTPDGTSTWYTTDDATYEITGVQLEVGDVATDFEHRSYHDDLARSQRYYYAHLNPLDSSNSTLGLAMYYDSGRAMMYVKFPVTMRTPPTAEITDVSNGYQLWVGGTYDFVDEFHIDTTDAGSVNGCELESDSEASGTTGNSAYVRRTNTSTTKFAFSAEL